MSGTPAKHAMKRTRIQRERDLTEIATLYLAQKTQQEIADILSATRPYTLGRTQITYDLKELVRRWRAESLEAVGDFKCRELQRINRLESKAWDCWEKSTKPFNVKRQHRSIGKDGKPGAGTMSSETQDRDGDPRFLGLVMQCIERRCRLIGVDAPSSLRVGDPDGKPLAPAVVAPVVHFIIPDNGRAKTTTDRMSVPVTEGGNGGNGGNGH